MSGLANLIKEIKCTIFFLHQTLLPWMLECPELSSHVQVQMADQCPLHQGSSFFLPRKMSSRMGLSSLNFSLVFSRRAHWLMDPIKPCLLDWGKRWRRQVAWMGSSSLWWMVSEMVLTACVIQHLEMYWCALGGARAPFQHRCEKKAGIG